MFIYNRAERVSRQLPDQYTDERVECVSFIGKEREEERGKSNELKRSCLASPESTEVGQSQPVVREVNKRERFIAKREHARMKSYALVDCEIL